MMIKRHTTLIFLALCFFATAHAQLAFEPATWSFGRINEADGRVSHVFTGINQGEKPLVILDVITSCGCTVPSFSRQPILPGAKTQITVTFDPANRPGSFTKELDVYSSEKRKITTLTIRGDVAPRKKTVTELYPVDAGGGLRLANTLCAFTYIYPGKRTQSAIGYTNTSAHRIRLELRPQTTTGLLTIDAPREIAPGAQGEINLSYLIPAESPRYGTLSDVLEIFADGRSNGTRVKVHGIGIDSPNDSTANKAPQAQLSEGIIKFGPVKRTAGLQRHTFLLSNTGASELIVRAVENGGHVGTNLTPGRRIASGNNCKVELTLDPAEQDFGVMTDYLILITNDPARPMQRLRITAIIED